MCMLWEACQENGLLGKGILTILEINILYAEVEKWLNEALAVEFPETIAAIAFQSLANT